MSTPGGYDPQQGNPYGDNPYGGNTPPPPPGAPNPYDGGAPPPPPGGYNPYGPAATAPAAPLDGVSVASLITALLCCTGPVGVLLGIIGIVRTKNQQRRGRWMSVVGILVGIVASGALAAGAVGLGWLATNAVTIDTAEVGDCLDITEDDLDILMWRKDCTEPHDAEVVHVGTYDEAADGADGQLTTDVCIAHLSDDDVQALERAGIEPADLEAVAFTPEDMSDGDRYVCYAESDEKLTEPLL